MNPGEDGRDLLLDILDVILDSINLRLDALDILLAGRYSLGESLNCGIDRSYLGRYLRIDSVYFFGNLRSNLAFGSLDGLLNRCLVCGGQVRLCSLQVGTELGNVGCIVSDS